MTAFCHLLHILLYNAAISCFLRSKNEESTKVYLMRTESVKGPRKTFSSWKEFLPKERWEKTVRPLKEEDRKTELAASFLLYQALREWGISEEKINAETECVLLWRTWKTNAKK